MKKRINILYIETGLGFGGAVTCLVALLKGLNKEKYNPIVVSSHNDEETKSLIENAGSRFFYIKGYERSASLNATIDKSAKLSYFIKGIVLTAVLFVEKILQIPFFVKTMRLAKKTDIDIIHLNTGINNNLEGIIVSRLLGIPSICHMRGPAYNSPEARFIARFITYFVSMSKFIENSLVKFSVPHNKLKIVYDGIDINECDKKANIAEMDKLDTYNFRKYNIGLFGCLLPWKGHKVFIRAIDILVKNKNLKETKFFIVGDVPAKKMRFKDDLIGLVNKLELSDYIIFTGYQKNVYQFMNKMNIITHTSINPEPFGRVIIEAMALGKPVIATKIGGPLEIIDDEINGILVEPNKPELLARTIYSLLKDENKLKEISKKAKETVKYRFNMASYIRNIENIYEEVVQ